MTELEKIVQRASRLSPLEIRLRDALRYARTGIEEHGDGCRICAANIEAIDDVLAEANRIEAQRAKWE